MIRGPAVRGRAGVCTGTATAYNSGFTRRSSRWSSLGLRQPARRSLRLLKGRSASVVPVSQVRKPAGRYTQWPFWGNVLEGQGSRSKIRNDLGVPSRNGGNHSRSSEAKRFIPSQPQDESLPVLQPVLVSRILPHPMPPRRQLSCSDPRIADIRNPPPAPPQFILIRCDVDKVGARIEPESGVLMISQKEVNGKNLPPGLIPIYSDTMRRAVKLGQAQNPKT